MFSRSAATAFLLGAVVDLDTLSRFQVEARSARSGCLGLAPVRSAVTASPIHRRFTAEGVRRWLWLAEAPISVGRQEARGPMRRVLM